MTRITTIIGNWKMNATVSDAAQMAMQIKTGIKDLHDVEVTICPSFTALSTVREILAGSGISVGAQDMYHETSGAFTGAVSPEMVAEFCNYVILGHSERRTLFGDTDDSIRLKVAAGVSAGLNVVMCVGEGLEDRESGNAKAVVERQVTSGLKGVIAVDQISIAYEPVWAIGTGKASTTDDAQDMMAHIRSILVYQFGNVANGLRLLYGGSVTDENISDYINEPDIDGALVGGASLKPEIFIKLVGNAANSSSQ